MARIRSVKPEFWSDRKLARMSRDARLLYIALWNHADEHGRCQGDVRWVKGHCLPYDDDLDDDAVERLLDELAAHSRLVRYEADGDPYLYLPKLGEHQRLEPAKVASKLPEPPAQIFSDESAPGADSSEPIVALHGAWSMEHAAAAGTVPPPRDSDDHKGDGDAFLAILQSKCDSAGLHMRWDKVTDEHRAELVDLIRTRGDGRLVEAARRTWNHNSPPVFAQAMLGTWRTVPPAGRAVAEVVSFCTEHGHEYEPVPCKLCRAELVAGER